MQGFSDVEIRVIALKSAIEYVTGLGDKKSCPVVIADKLFDFIKEGMKDE